MRVKYVGPSVAVEIAATGQTVERGGSVEVDDALGRRLCQQSYWEEQKPPRVSKKEDN